MRNISIALLGGMILGLSAPSLPAVEIFNHFQDAQVKIIGDGEVLDEFLDEYNGGWDADLVAEGYYWGYANAASTLKTTYTPDRLTVNGQVTLAVSPTWDYDEISAHGRVYYQTAVKVTDQPVWIRIKGCLTPDPDHWPEWHFLVSPLGYWNVVFYPDEKVWMFNTAMLDIGEHLIYGAVNYTISAPSQGLDDSLAADYYFVIEIFEANPFESADADLNHDGKVDLQDVALFASAWLWSK